MFRGFAPSNRNDHGVCQHFRTINNTSKKKMLRISSKHVVRPKTVWILSERKENRRGCALSKWDDLEKYPFKNCNFFQVKKNLKYFFYGRHSATTSKFPKLRKIFQRLHHWTPRSARQNAEDTPYASWTMSTVCHNHVSFDSVGWLTLEKLQFPQKISSDALRKFSKFKQVPQSFQKINFFGQNWRKIFFFNVRHLDQALQPIQNFQKINIFWI